VVAPPCSPRDGRGIAPRQRIGVETARDGARIAFASCGSGPPILWTGSWISHLELDWRSPMWRPWIDMLAARRRVVRYDLRGSGLSERDAGDARVDTWVDDLDVVANGAGLECFPLLGVCQRGPIAIAYAVRHPERVSRLILYGTYSRGAFTGGFGSKREREARALTELIELGWGSDQPAFREMFAKIFMPDGPAMNVELLGEIQRQAANAQSAARLWQAFHELDVESLAEQIQVPTLVVHVRGDGMVPLEAGERLASVIPSAELVTLEGKNHILMEHEASWPHFVEALDAFLADEAREIGVGASGDAFPDLTPREREVLELVARGLANDDIATALGLRSKTVRNHVSHLFEKLGVSTRAEAIVEARDAGYG